MLGLSKLQSVNEKRKRSIIQERPKSEEESAIDFEGSTVTNSIEEQEWKNTMADEVNIMETQQKITNPVPLFQKVKKADPMSMYQTGRQADSLTSYQTMRQPKEEKASKQSVEYEKITPSKYFEVLEKVAPQNPKDETTYQPVNSEPESYDELMKQIEDFRSKAEELQATMDSKAKAAMKLQEQIDERKTQMNEFSRSMEAQMDHMMDQLGNQIQYMEDSMISDMVENFNQINGKLMNEFKQVAEQVNVTDTLLQGKIDQMKIEFLTKAHDEGLECRKHSERLVKELDGQMDGLAKHYIVRRTNKLSMVVLILSLLNSVGLIVIFLVLIGVIRF